MKLRNKLILSCAALAAVATTAVSTTFAWYTSNTTVSASGLTAETVAGSDKLLLISSSGKKGTWGSSVTFDTSSIKFIPYSLENGEYLPIDQDTATPSAANKVTITKTTDQVVNGGILAFNLYFMSAGDALEVNVNNFRIVNTTQALPTKTILQAGAGVDESTGASTYTCDLMRALVVSVQTATVTGNAGTGSFTATDLSTASLYNLDNYTTYTDTVGANANAHTYYNKVTGKTLKTSAGTANTADTLTTSNLPVAFSDCAAAGQQGTGTWALGTAPAANSDTTKQNYMVAHFEIFLNGWDLYCFDAVQGQTLTFDFAFNVPQAQQQQGGQGGQG